jgi:CRP-like cAMP-binding protein
LILQDTPGDEIFFLLKGAMGIFKHEPSGLIRQVTVLRPYSIFGETAILENCLRTADVVALEESTVLVISKQDFLNSMAMNNDKTQTNLLQNKIAFLQYFSSSPLFKTLPKEAVQQFWEEGRIREVAAQTVVTKQGDRDKSFYLILRGELQVKRQSEVLGSLGSGSYFGEIALLTDLPRTATVTCETPCLLLQLTSAAFWKILTNNIHFSLHLEEIAERRLEEEKFEPLLDMVRSVGVQSEVNDIAKIMHLETSTGTSVNPQNFTEFVRKSMKDQRGVRDTSLDLWQTPYRLVASGQSYKVVSAGPDKQFNTNDDIVAVIP